MAQRERVIGALAVDREIRRPAYPLVMPGRLRIPLLGKVQRECSLDERWLEREPRRLLQLLGKLAADRIGDVDLAALQCSEPRGLVVDHLEDKTLQARRLAPVR